MIAANRGDLSGCSNSRSPNSRRYIYCNDNYPSTNIDRIIVRGLTLCDWELPPPRLIYEDGGERGADALTCRAHATKNSAYTTRRPTSMPQLQAHN
jgi:hypothetical protein